jgi:hypothetical protein
MGADAHSEAARLLGLLGLPNDTTMETRSFTIIEERVDPYGRKVCHEILIDNLIKEARLAMTVTSEHKRHQLPLIYGRLL